MEQLAIFITLGLSTLKDHYYPHLHEQSYVDADGHIFTFMLDFLSKLCMCKFQHHKIHMENAIAIFYRGK